MEKNKYNIFKKIVESSYDGIYVTDGEGNTLFINQAYEDLTGLSIKDLQGRNMQALLEEGIFDESGSLQAIKNREKVTISQKLKNGKVIFVTSSPVINEKGKIIYVVTNVRDMRELERLERQFLNTKMLVESYRTELEILKSKEKEDRISKNKEMLNVIKLLETAAQFNTTILLEGETGTGKTYFAKKIHLQSQRKNKKFIEINCGAIPSSLIESELFGYEKGAFTGADRNGKIGLFELANDSTLFLDEISELTLDMQVKLLKVLETGYIMKVGGIEQIPIDARIIVASNKCLKKLVKNGTFREDLYYRINVIPIRIPPIRERKEDIVTIATNFLKNFNQKYNLKKKFSEEVFQYFLEYPWPGNIREIKNIVEQLVVISKEDEIKIDILPKEFFENNKKNEIEEYERICTKCMDKYMAMNLKDATKEFQRDIIKKLAFELKSQKKIAKKLNVDPSTITRKLQKN